MKNLVRVGLLFVELILAILWIKNPEGNYEPYIVIFGVIWGLIEFLAKVNSPTGRENPSKFDESLFEELQADLPAMGAIEFIRKNNMAGFPFDSNNLNQLGEFQIKWAAPNYKFNDSNLEQKKNSLVKAIKHYFQSINTHTMPLNTPGWISVPQDLEIDNPQKFRIAVDDLYKKADVVTRLYDEIVSLGRAKFA